LFKEIQNKKFNRLKVTIITVTYNAEKYLNDCIQSVLAQSYPHIEYLIMDGGSKDETVEIIRNYENRITHWVSEKDAGMYDALNKGMLMATGDVIGILNSDDMLYDSTVIENVVKKFQQEKADAIYGDLVYVDANKTDRIIRTWKGQPYNRNRFRWGWMPAHPTFYVKRSVVEQFGGYLLEFSSAADYEWMSRLLYKNQVSAAYLPHRVVRMRTGGQSNVTWRARWKANRNDRRSMAKNGIPLPALASIFKPLRKLIQYI
jgi:glycosyltransferase involved in cell wall biosynthesis